MSFDVTRDALPDGFCAIEASAGTRKTWTLSHLAVRLLLTGAEPGLRRILVVTFTNAAADELAARIRGVLAACRAVAAGRPGGTPHAEALVAMGEAALGGRAAVRQRLDLAWGDLDELAVGTIHACCKRVLETSAFLSGEAFTAELAPDDSELIAAAVRDAWRSRLWSNARLARFATAWSVAEDTRLWQRWNRHPGTRVVPQVGLEEVLAATEAAAAAIRAAATPEAFATLDTWDWKKDAKPEAAIAHLASGGDPLSAVGEIAELGVDAEKLVKKADQPAAETHPLLVACRALVAAVAMVRVAWLGWLCPAVAERLRSSQAVAGVWTQDDLLRRVRAALDAHPDLAVSLRTRWPVALIDEFQDTDPVQWEVFRRAYAGGGRLVVVGDPKQAIYRFRGADLGAYLTAVDDAERLPLLINHRSDPRLVEAVQALIGRTAAPFLDPRVALAKVAGKADPARAMLDDDDAPLTVLIPPDDGRPPRREAVVASEIVRLLRDVRLGQNAVQPRDCAVLVRTSAQARTMREALRACGVPATMAADGDVLDSPAAAELHAVLTALARPRDGQALRLALATRGWGRSAAEIAALTADDGAWQRLVDEVELWHRRWQRHGLTAAIEAWGASVGALARYAALPDGERWLTDWRHAVEVLHAAGSGGLRPVGLLAWWARRSPEGVEARRLRLEGDASAVRILTMHVAKGLEFPIVFCPYLGTRRDREDTGVLVADEHGARLVLAGPELEAAETAVAHEDDAEQLRLAYVALTRARVRAYVLWGMWDQKGYFHLPLRSSLGWWLRPDGQEHTAWRAATGPGAPNRDQVLADAVLTVSELADAGIGIGMRAAGTESLLWQEAEPQVAGDGLRQLGPDARASLDAPRCVTSFSGLLGQGLAVPERRRGDEPQQRDAAAVQPASGMRALARGADVGDALHLALEAWDFTVDPTPLVRTQLARLGLDASGPRQPHAEDPVAAVSACFQALATLPIRLDGRELLLAAVPERLRRVEWEFHLPLARVRPPRILDLIQMHGALPGPVLASLPALREAAPAGGFLKGFVDLLVGDGTAWWVLDWKSNHLGDRIEDYASDRLWPAMVEHGYVVQALIYLLALHRHLRARLGAGYAYERDVGGAAWVFLRGVDAGQGVWTWKPPLALVEAMERELLEDRP
jgi:exodeoxyribonuclease V beta subunit